MSDTTKINKARIDGVLYDLGGTSSGGISGAYLAPKTLTISDYTGFAKATMNPIALIEQLEKAGISVDEPVLDSNESAVTFFIGYSVTIEGTSRSRSPIIYMVITYNEDITSVEFQTMRSGSQQIYTSQTTLRGIINDIFASGLPDFNFTLDSYVYGYLENLINVKYSEAQETLHYYISNMTEFCEEVIIEYNPSSGSGSY